ncbi:MAG: DEAD/DEAH box helicase [Acidobacteriota bacterium]
MKTFSELPLSSVLRANLAQHNLVQPTPVQSESIPPQLEGRDVVVTAQTGTGKTLAFVLPMLELLGRQPLPVGVSALILSPTRELAIQIHETFMKIAAGTGIRAAVVVGGMSEQKQLQMVRRGAHIVIATPGRLSDFLNRKLVKLNTARFLVLDEADRMLDMGFLPTIKMIMATLPSERQTMFFSATIEPTVAHLIKSYLKDPVRIAIGSISKPSDHVDLHVYEVEQDRKLGLLEKMLQDEQGSFLVFARTKHGADRLAKKLVRSGSNATSIHGDRTQSQRNQALKGFQDGHYRVLVATDVAARGIHVEGIAHVVNFDLPQVPEDFIHRVGRTGRAGTRGVASTFYVRNERGDIGKIERVIGMKLTKRTVDPSIQREQKVVEIPAAREVPAHHAPFRRSGNSSGSAKPFGAKKSSGAASGSFSPRPARRRTGR